MTYTNTLHVARYTSLTLDHSAGLTSLDTQPGSTNHGFARFHHQQFLNAKFIIFSLAEPLSLLLHRGKPPSPWIISAPPDRSLPHRPYPHMQLYVRSLPRIFPTQTTVMCRINPSNTDAMRTGGLSNLSIYWFTYRALSGTLVIGIMAIKTMTAMLIQCG